MEPKKYIVVEGVIGVGKTSMAKMLSQRWEAQRETQTCFEIFEENPFLTGGFYKNTPEFAFNTEIFFLLSRFRQQRALNAMENLVVSDYFFEKNWIFAQLNLKGADLEIYKALYDRFMPEIRTPDLIVFLQADLETLMRRIYFRDREFERSLSPTYLESLMNKYYRFFSTYTKAPVLTIQTNGLDFVNDPADFRKMAALIEERISGQVQLSLQTKERSREVSKERATEAHA
jgi:deoxyguanosine kinase